jgi:hypothetical protein
MRQRAPLVLSALALAVAAASSTPPVQAAAAAVRTALFAKNAGAVNGIKASARPQAGKLVPLGRDGKFPVGVLPASEPGPQGVQGPPGPRGADGRNGVDGRDGVNGTFRAYATVTVGPPALDAARTKNFTSVTMIPTGSPGRYCLTPAAGISPTDSTAIVSPEFGDSVGTALATYVWLGGSECPTGQFEVITLSGGAASSNVAFTIGVP